MANSRMILLLSEKESIKRRAIEGIRSWDDGTNQAVNEICHKALLPEFHTWEWKKKKSQTKLMNFHLSPLRWLNQWTDCEKSMYPINRRHFLASNWVICCKTAWTAAPQKSNWEKYLLQRVKIKFALLVLCANVNHHLLHPASAQRITLWSGDHFEEVSAVLFQIQYKMESVS